MKGFLLKTPGSSRPACKNISGKLPPFRSLKSGVPPSTFPPSGTSSSSMTPVAGAGTCTEVWRNITHAICLSVQKTGTCRWLYPDDLAIIPCQSQFRTPLHLLSLSHPQLNHKQQYLAHRQNNMYWNAFKSLCSMCWCKPFSHLTSPSVTDSANAGVLTVTTSSSE